MTQMNHSLVRWWVSHQTRRTQHTHTSVCPPPHPLICESNPDSMCDVQAVIAVTRIVYWPALEALSHLMWFHLGRWHINQGKTPWDFVNMVWDSFLDCNNIMLYSKSVCVWRVEKTGLGKKEVSFRGTGLEEKTRHAGMCGVSPRRKIIVWRRWRKIYQGNPKRQTKVAEVHPNDDGILNDVSLPGGRPFVLNCHENSDMIEKGWERLHGSIPERMN